MFYSIMNDLHTRIAVCYHRGTVGTDLSVWVTCWSVFDFMWFVVWLLSITHNQLLVTVVCLWVRPYNRTIIRSLRKNIKNRKSVNTWYRKFVCYIQVLYFSVLVGWLDNGSILDSKLVAKETFTNILLCITDKWRNIHLCCNLQVTIWRLKLTL